MQELARSLTAPRITLLGYAFERRWLTQCADRLQRRPIAHRVSTAEKAVLLGSTGMVEPPLPDVLPVRVETRDIVEDDIWGFEQRLRAARKGIASVPSQA